MGRSLITLMGIHCIGWSLSRLRSELGIGVVEHFVGSAIILEMFGLLEELLAENIVVENAVQRTLAEM